MFKLFVLAATLGMPFAAQSASLGVHAYVFGLVPSSSGGTERAEVADDRYSDDTAVEGPSRSAAARIDQGGTAYAGSSSADIETGAYSSAVQVTRAILPGNLASAEAATFESFEVRGTGSISVRLALTGGWELPDGGAGGLFLLGRMYIGELGDPDGADIVYRVIRDAGETPVAGSVSDALVHVLKVSDGASYGINTWVRSELENASGSSSAYLAGALSLVPSPGVAVAFSDPAFLSRGDRPAPSPVPLPASAALLLAGIGALGMSRRRAAGTLVALVLAGSLAISGQVHAQAAPPVSHEKPVDAAAPKGGSNVPPPVWIAIGLLIGIVVVAVALSKSDGGAAFLPPA